MGAENSLPSVELHVNQTVDQLLEQVGVAASRNVGIEVESGDHGISDSVIVSVSNGVQTGATELGVDCSDKLLNECSGQQEVCLSVVDPKQDEKSILQVSQEEIIHDSCLLKTADTETKDGAVVCADAEIFTPSKQLKTGAFPSSPGSGSHNKRRRSTRICNETCEMERSKLVLKINQLSTEKMTFKQKCETSENHQVTLRNTLSSKDDIIRSQETIIKNNETKMEELQKTVSKQELTIRTHNDVGMSCLDLVVGNVSEEIDSPVNNLSKQGKELFNQNMSLRDEIKQLKIELSVGSTKIDTLEKELECALIRNENVVDQLSESAEKIKQCEKTAKGLKAKMLKNEEVILAKERDMKVCMDSLKKAEERILDMEGENNKLVSTLSSVEKMNQDMGDEIESLKAKIDNSSHTRLTDHPEVLAARLKSNLEEKEVEIRELNESLQCNEKVLGDVKADAARSLDQVRSTQKLYESEKESRIRLSSKMSDLELTNQDLSHEIKRLSSQLSRSRELNNLSHQLPLVSEESISIDRAPEDVTNRSMEHSTTMDTEMCFFKLYGGEECCRKGEKCKYSHEIDTKLLNDDEWKVQKMSELSRKIGKCTFEMVKRGSCPKGAGCDYQHQAKPSEMGKKLKAKTISYCFKEVVKAGSCPRGRTCRFSHDVSDTNRNDEGFLRKIREEKLSKASKCVNEYRKPGSCSKGPSCSFSHIISEEDRNNPEIQKKMESKWSFLVEKRKDKNMDNKDNNMVHRSEVSSEMREVLLLLKEFKVFISSARCP